MKYRGSLFINQIKSGPFSTTSIVLGKASCSATQDSSHVANFINGLKHVVTVCNVKELIKCAQYEVVNLLGSSTNKWLTSPFLRLYLTSWRVYLSNLTTICIVSDVSAICVIKLLHHYFIPRCIKERGRRVMHRPS